MSFKNQIITKYNDSYLYSDNLDSAWIGSANLTNNGLSDNKNSNIEVLNFCEVLDDNSKAQMLKIINDSTLVNEHIYNQYKEYVDNLPEKDDVELPDIDIEKIDPFLSSQLPMSLNPTRLWNMGNQRPVDAKEWEIYAVKHDEALFGINAKATGGFSISDFREVLKEKFLENKFVFALSKLISPDGIQFGLVKEWIHDNCTDVPLPRRWELTENVQTLYDWFEKLGDGKYVVDIPGAHSQRITKF